ncbi:hypothetical protein ACIKTA_03960 [Hansschlegelia beijingensis]
MAVLVACETGLLVASSMTYRGNNIISFAGRDHEGYTCEVLVNCFHARVTLREVPSDEPDAKKCGFNLPTATA